MPQVYIAAGSNVEPLKNLALALTELRRSFPDARWSAAYRNAAVGFEGPDFINLVAGFSTGLTLAQVLTELHRIETLCGRPRNAPKWEPRAMDLDMLLYGDEVRSEPGVTLPRPDLVRRPYMLGPMAEIAPGVRHPTLQLTMSELWQRFDRSAHAMNPVSLPLPAEAQRP
jgi:2-amino-4-hydroxy-6-hydroxymethyldihydropteridine diphosphokinase